MPKLKYTHNLVFGYASLYNLRLRNAPVQLENIRSACVHYIYIVHYDHVYPFIYGNKFMFRLRARALFATIASHLVSE